MGRADAWGCAVRCRWVACIHVCMHVCVHMHVCTPSILNPLPSCASPRPAVPPSYDLLQLTPRR